MLRRPLMNWGRAGIFGSSEAAGVDLEGGRGIHDLLVNDVGAYSNSSNITAFYDSRNSKGNFIGDVDNNTMLDLCSMENLSLGHNHEAFTSNFNNKDWDKFTINSGLDASQRATRSIEPHVSEFIAPSPQCSSVTLTSGRSAVEQAIFAAINVRGGNGQRFKAMSFTGADHGSLALSQTSALGWPTL